MARFKTMTQNQILITLLLVSSLGWCLDMLQSTPMTAGCPSLCVWSFLGGHRLILLPSNHFLYFFLIKTTIFLWETSLPQLHGGADWAIVRLALLSAVGMRCTLGSSRQLPKTQILSGRTQGSKTLEPMSSCYTDFPWAVLNQYLPRSGP